MRTMAALWVSGMLAGAGSAWAQADAPADYFVALDGLETLTSGPSAGLPNPNFGRLTLLVAHRDAQDPARNDFHAIGAFGYASSEDDEPGGVISTSANNRIPELSTGLPPLRLHLEGELAGRWSSLPTESEYSRLAIASIQSLASLPADSPDGILFRSAEGRWTTPLGAAVVELQRISLTPGLRVSDALGQDVFEGQPRHALGDGDALRFFPVYSVPEAASPGTYSATFKLVDAAAGSDRLAESGRVTFDFAVPRRGDLDADNDVDSDDLRTLEAGLGELSTGLDDPRDLNGDGTLDERDRDILLGLLGGAS